MAEFQMRLAARREIAKGTMACWFDTKGANYEFHAGQHADFAFQNPRQGDKDGDNARTFSLASAPHERGPIMVAMRMRASGFKTALKTATIGTMFKVSAPRGSFTLHKDFRRPAVFIAGGIGITPIRSIVHTATEGGLPHKLYLFYANRQDEEATFLPELEELARRAPSLILVPTVTQVNGPAWRHHQGHIDRSLLAQYVLGFHGPVYYVAGPSGMVAAMTTMLEGAGVSADDIKTEEFGDYRANPTNRS